MVYRFGVGLMLMLAVATCGEDEPSNGDNNNGGATNNNSSSNNNASSNNNSSSNNNASNNNMQTAAWPIERVSVGAGGVQSDVDTNGIDVGQSSRYVAFESAATTVSAVVPTNTRGIFVRDRMNDTTVLSSLNDSGQVMGALQTFSLSDDGTRVMFHSTYEAFDGDQSSRQAFFVRDLTNDTTIIATLTDDEMRINGNSREADMSGDGRYVAFISDGLNLPVTNGRVQLYLRDLVNNSTRFISGTVSEPANQAARSPALSDDGQRIVFGTRATNLVAGANGRDQIYLHDVGSASITAVSVNAQGDLADSAAQAPAISGDGRYVSFYSTATNLVAGVTDGRPYLYLHDTMDGTTVVASVDVSGQPVASIGAPATLSDDGRYATFTTADAAEPGDMNNRTDVYRFDRTTGTSTRISLSSTKEEPQLNSNEPAISGDGGTVVFLSAASDMVPGQTVLQNEGYAVDLP